MRRCQHFCGCEGNAVGRDPDTGLRLCAGCLGRSILGTDCSLARKYFVHVPAHFGDGAWTEPPPLRDGDHTPVPGHFEVFLTIRTGFEPPDWDFMPLAEPTTPVFVGAIAPSPGATASSARLGTGFGCVRVASATATNPQRPPKDPPPGPLPPPPGRPVQPNPPRR